MTPPLIIGRSGIAGFGFHLRFEASCWEKLPDELNTAIDVLGAYRETALKMNLREIGRRQRMDSLEIPIVWGMLEAPGRAKDGE